ncbi:MAG: phage major capsid protein [Planctomycetota bacterium]
MPESAPAKTETNETPGSWQDRKRHVEERSQTLANMQQMLKEADDAKRDLTDDENKQFDEMNTRAESLAAKINRYDQLIAATAAADAARDASGEQREQRSQTPGREDIGGLDLDARGPADHQEEQRAKAFDSYLRYGTEGMTPDEKRHLQTGMIEHDGGLEHRAVARGSIVWGPRGFQTELIKALRDFTGVLQAGARTLTTSNGNEIGMLTVDDTGNEGSDEKAEGSAAAEVDPVFGNKKLNAFTYDSSVVLVPWELLQDSAVDLGAEILDLASERIGVKLNKRTTSGTGVGQPLGFLTAASAGHTTTDDAAISYEDLVDCFHSVSAPYRRRGGVWMLNDKTLAAVRKLKDDAGQYIFAAGRAGEPNLLLDKPYVVNPDMPNIEADAKPIAFGDFSRYRIRYVANPYIRRIEEPYITQRKVGFYVAQRADGTLTDPRAVKTLQMAGIGT